MAIFSLGDLVPKIDKTAFVHPDATIIGDVEIGPESSVWPQAVLRGDNAPIRVGARTSIQDGSVLHIATGLPTEIGDDCVIGHIVHLEGCVIENCALVGSGSVVLHRAVVRSGALVGANAVVPGGMEVPTGAMALGIPAKLKMDCVDAATIQAGADAYVERTRRFLAEMKRID